MIGPLEGSFSLWKEVQLFQKQIVYTFVCLNFFKMVYLLSCFHVNVLLPLHLLNVFFCMHVSWVVGVFSLEQTDLLPSYIQEEEGQG